MKFGVEVLYNKLLSRRRFRKIGSVMVILYVKDINQPVPVSSMFFLAIFEKLDKNKICTYNGTEQCHS
jgi:hypothetical protein